MPGHAIVAWPQVGLCSLGGPAPMVNFDRQFWCRRRRIRQGVPGRPARHLALQLDTTGLKASSRRIAAFATVLFHSMHMQ